LAGAGVALLVGVYFFRPTGATPTSPLPEHALPAAPAAPIVAAPPPRPAVPASFEIGLDSVPTGASVFLGEILIGTTPTVYKTEARGEPLEFTFRAQGFEPEKIQAMPAPGLTLHARLTTPVATKRPALGKRKRVAPLPSGPSTDIQTER
jgi:serine/threonine-protein kinase